MGISIIAAIFLTSQTAHAEQTPPQCLPFFDSSNATVETQVVTDYNNGKKIKGRVDITPQFQKPGSKFSSAILNACGQWGRKIPKEEIKTLITTEGLPVIQALLKTFKQFSQKEMTELLVRAWTGKEAFEHIFCGQPEQTNIGGLHFTARYQDLQKRGSICRMPNNKDEEVYPNLVFTLGVYSEEGSATKKSFSPLQTAEDIFYEASREFIENCNTHGALASGCISRFYKDGSFVNTLICSPGFAIVTFYPLALLSGLFSYNAKLN
jgi:hypothetical protein